ncbi:hypothetical protein [Parvularcula dongshanensis]|uniref:Sulfite exporter TauE/SafE n=1 Tax=Parvularcula dongshanensis TaxID=1173995 RepID=A0A840HZQ1_9PROT|nr:hypothetical protein [Parvularcula dongshanensis]MBB4658316.1 sulfite exporter TauE/SafE [Parvularcula dongshanensis]
MNAFRILAYVLLGLALALFGADVVTSLEAQQVTLRATRAILSLFGLDLGVQEGGWFARVGNFLLATPLWASLATLGALMVLILRPPR